MICETTCIQTNKYIEQVTKVPCISMKKPVFPSCFNVDGERMHVFNSIKIKGHILCFSFLNVS